jgi:hypothetical protein
MFFILFINAFMCDAKWGSITCSYNIVNVLLKTLFSFVSCFIVIVKQSIYQFPPSKFASVGGVFFGLVLHQRQQMPALYQVSLFLLSFSFGIPFEHMFCQYLHNTMEFKRTCTWIVESCIFPQDKVRKAIFIRAF